MKKKTMIDPPDDFDETLLRKWVEWIQACPVDGVDTPAMFENILGLLAALDTARARIAELELAATERKV